MARNSFGTIDKLPSGRYRARYTIPGTRERVMIGTFDSKREAKVALAKAQVSLERTSSKGYFVTEHQLFGQYAKLWVKQRITRSGDKLSDSTTAYYNWQLSNSLRFFNDYQMHQISPALVREWYNYRIAEGKTAAARDARLLRAIFATAVEDRIIDFNPVASRFCTSKAGIKHRPPTEKELKLIIEYFDNNAPKLKLALLIAAYGGLRLSEWRALRRCDLTRENGRYMIHVTRQAYKSKVSKGDWIVTKPKSAAGVRTVPLPSFITEIVDEHLATYVQDFDEALLFPAHTSQFLSDGMFKRYWDKARDAAGLRKPVTGVPGKRYECEVREHDLRAFAATKYSQSGATIKETMELLGHSSIVAAMAYQHTTGRDKELIDRMPKLV